MLNRSWRQALVATVVAFVLLATAACGGASTVTVQATAPKATGTGTPGTTTTPGTTSTGTPAKSCADLLPGAGPASAGASFADLPLPSNSVTTPVTKTKGGGDGQFTIYEQDLCTTGTTTQTIFSFFANTLPSKSWPAQKWFPFDGYFYDLCGDPYCWASGGNAPPRHVGLETVVDHGNGVVGYHLRLAIPPTAPTCDSTIPFKQGYYYNMDDLGKYTQTDVYQKIPFPPLTRISPNSTPGHIGYNLCSAPSAATIMSFMNTHLVGLGWKSPGGGNWSNGKYSVSFSFTSSGNWTMLYGNPAIVG